MPNDTPKNGTTYMEKWYEPTEENQGVALFATCQRHPEQCSKARVLTTKPDPKAQEPSPARNNTNPGVQRRADRN